MKRNRQKKKDFFLKDKKDKQKKHKKRTLLERRQKVSVVRSFLSYVSCTVCVLKEKEK